MTPSKQVRIVHLFLSKLELLTDEERSVLIDAIALINNPRYIASTESSNDVRKLGVKALI